MPSSVRGPVLAPPCILQRPLGIATRRHGALVRRAQAPQRGAFRAAARGDDARGSSLSPRVDNQTRGRFPDGPIFPGQPISSNASASGICTRSTNSQNAREDMVPPVRRGEGVTLLGGCGVCLAMGVQAFGAPEVQEAAQAGVAD